MARGAKRKRRQGSLRSIADILDGVYEGAKRRPIVQTFSWWDRTVPPRISRNARPVRLSHGTLVVHTRTAAWSQELSFFEEDLLASVRERVPGVKRIRIRVGPAPDAPPQPDGPPIKTTPLDLGELPGDVARALARVGDDGVRNALTRAVCTSLAPPPPEAERRRRGGRRGR